ACRRARRPRGGVRLRHRRGRGPRPLAPARRAGIRAGPDQLRSGWHAPRSGSHHPGAVLLRRGGRILSGVRAGTGANPTATAGVPGSGGPGVGRGTTPVAGRRSRGGASAAGRPFRPSPPERAKQAARPRLLGAPSVVRHVVVGTAGHIDHGKTALVKALTGVDTDRWAEEQRRGITIDLGFAPLLLDHETQVSIVDVPGHEGFVRNMLAGATGIDAALLIIAADEGIMPQTEEHLAIVELLRVRRGVPVLTKRDLVDDEWLQLLSAEVAARLSRSPIRWEPPVATSARTGAGLPELREAVGRV